MLLEKFNCLLASDEVSARPAARPRSFPLSPPLQLGHLNDDVWDDDALLHEYSFKLPAATLSLLSLPDLRTS